MATKIKWPSKFAGRGAILSKKQRYRYLLWRVWDESQPLIAFCLLNPSTADDKIDDPTLKRCMTFAKLWGYGGVVLCNAYAYRITTPIDLTIVKNSSGVKCNPKYLGMVAREVKHVVCGWGAFSPKEHQNYVKMILQQNGAKLYHLGLNKDGSPKHPLYIEGTTQKQRWH